MGNKKYIENIQKLDFQIENHDDSSVYLVDKLDEYVQQGDISPYVIIALDKAKLFEATAVYFRLFDDGRPPLAQIYLYDNINNPQSSEYYAIKHREIWSSCEVAVFFVVDRDQISIFDSRKPVETHENGTITSTRIDCVDLLSDIDITIDKYRAQNFNNGSFWENQISGRNFLNSKIASERLINGLHSVRDELRKGDLPHDLIDRLLIICILIKYLEETGADDNGENYARAFFAENTGYERLEDVIRYNKLRELLVALASHFRGGIFPIDDDFTNRLKNSDVSGLARFFEAGYKNNLFGWSEYSFAYIPIELISNFYEEFIPKTGVNSKKATGAIYTPSFVVNLLIDENLPLTELNGNAKLIDPACGSGIFLVTAYKRLVQRWRIKNIVQGKLADTTPEILNEILSKNIFGVDINSTSIDLSMFSLQLALCSMLTPKQIWTNLTFVDLRSNNLIEKDFFEFLVQDKTAHDYDFVVGNPPFIQGRLGGKSYEYYAEILRKKYPISFNNPAKEFALLFLEKAMHLIMNKEGKLCLILPSGPLLYTENSIKFRSQLFSCFDVTQIVDFTFLRRVLFEATVASLAIFVTYKKPSAGRVLHIIAKRTKQSKERFYFEFDHYDFYPVPKELTVGKLNVWKCNLLGGFRVCDIIDGLNRIKPNFEYWCMSNGITISGSASRDHVSGVSDKMTMRKLPLFEDEKNDREESSYYWGVKKNITKGAFPIEISAKDFRKPKFDGIEFSGTSERIGVVKEYIRQYSNLIVFYIAATSGRQGIRSPYVFDLADLKKAPFFANGDDIPEFDEIVIDDTIKFTLDEFGNGEKSLVNTKFANVDDLIDFARVYSKNINTHYSADGKCYKLVDLIEGDAYFVCELAYTDKEPATISMAFRRESLDNLLSEWNPSRSAKIHKIIRWYDDKNGIIRIIKPKQLRFWLRSKALRDADETFDDILTHTSCSR